MSDHHDHHHANHGAGHGGGHDTGHSGGHDDWFRHDDDEARPQTEHAAHVNTTAIGLTLLAIVFGVMFTVIILSMYFVQYANSRKAMLQEGTQSAEPYRQYAEQSEKDLARFGWVDQAAGTVNIPIERAIDAVVADYGRPGVQAASPWRGPARPSPAKAGEVAMEVYGAHD